MGAKVTVEAHALGDNMVANMVDRDGLDEQATIQEAIDAGYVVGKISHISQNAKGVLTSMIKGIARDGDGRKIDEFFSIQPYATGSLDDVTDDIDRSKISVEVMARMLKQTKLDTSGWEITLEGAQGALKINSVSTGEAAGVVTIGEEVDVNGMNFGETMTVRWKVTGTDAQGEVPASMLVATPTRLTIDEHAFEALDSAQYNGKTLELTVKSGNSVGRKSATVRIA